MPLGQFTYDVFVVLDERSTEDDICLVVHGGADFDKTTRYIPSGQASML
jgi:hypothetical protein